MENGRVTRGITALIEGCDTKEVGQRIHTLLDGILEFNKDAEKKLAVAVLSGEVEQVKRAQDVLDAIHDYFVPEFLDHPTINDILGRASMETLREGIKRMGFLGVKR